MFLVIVTAMIRIIVILRVIMGNSTKKCSSLQGLGENAKVMAMMFHHEFVKQRQGKNTKCQHGKPYTLNPRT